MSENRKILIIEDSPTYQRALADELVSRSYDIICANSGEEGLELIKENPPDLIVLDVMMPRLNGYQVCKSLKENPATKSIPVLMLTAKAEEADRFWGERVGADLYMTKPFDFEVLEKQIERLMKQRV